MTKNIQPSSPVSLPEGEGCSFLSVKISCLRFLRKDYLIEYIHL